jgi:hypothetical protein
VILMAAHNQRDLFAASGSPDRRPGVAGLLPRLLAALDGRGWMSARVLARELDTDDRSIREAAHQSAEQILGGQRGYCLTSQASLEDVDRVTRWLLSQAGHMRGRVVEIERVRHGVTR